MKKLTVAMEQALIAIDRANMSKKVVINRNTERALIERSRIVFAYPAQIAKDAGVEFAHVKWFMEKYDFVECFVTTDFYADLMIDLRNTKGAYAMSLETEKNDLEISVSPVKSKPSLNSSAVKMKALLKIKRNYKVASIIRSVKVNNVFLSLATMHIRQAEVHIRYHALEKVNQFSYAFEMLVKRKDYPA